MIKSMHIAFLAVILALTACGGHSRPAPPDDTSAATEAQTAVVVDVGVPAARALISNISGANGPLPFDGRTAVATATADDFPLVVATNAANEIVLASFQRDTQLALNSVTTAGALVRLLLGDRPAPVTEQEWMRWIAEDAGFGPLVATIDAALAAGRTPGSDDAVAAALAPIADRIMVRSETPTAATRLLAVSDVVSPLPYTILSLPIGDLRVTGGLLNVHNSTPLTWSASTTTYAGQPLGAADAPPVLLPAIDFAGWVLAHAPGWIAPAGVTLAADGDRAFYLTVGQTDASRRKNLVDLLGAALGLVAQLGIGNAPGTCTTELVQALMGNQLVQLAAAPDGEQLQAFLVSAGASAQIKVFSNNLVGTPPRLCPGQQWLAHRNELLRKLVPLAGRLMLIARVAKIATNTSKIFMLGGRAYWMKTYWTRQVPVRVCVAASAIANCASRFEFEDGPDLTLLEGAQVPLGVLAFDANGRRTPVPSSVRFRSDSPDITIDAVSGTARAASRPGAASITVTDAATNVQQTATVKVDGGRLDPATLQLEPSGASGNILLVASSGGPIKTGGVALTWAIADPAVARLLAADGAATGIVFPQQPGDTTVVVNNPVSGKILSTKVSVGSGSFAFEVVVRVPGASGELGCTHYDNTNGNGDYSYDVCGQYNDARFRCVGSGCTVGRFYVAIAQSRLIINTNCIFEFDTCAPRTDVQEVYGIDPAATAAYTPEAARAWWFNLSDGGWVKAWPSVSDIGPNMSITKNIVIRDASTAYSPVGYVESARLELIFRIYDRERNTYLDLPLTSSIP
jgi:hypothetical protein